MLEDVDRIEVIRGPGSTYWGANAQNGVINIITKSANETQGMLVSAGGGTIEQGFGSVRYGAETKDGLNYRLYAKYFDRDGMYHEDDNRKNTDAWQKAQIGFKLDKDVSDKDVLTIQADVFDADLGVYETLSSLTAPYAPIADEDMDSFGGNILARWYHEVSPSSDWEFKFFYDYLERKSSYFDSDVDMVDFDFQHRFTLPLRQEILWGIGYRLISYDTSGSFTLGFEPEDDTNDLFTGFVQDEISLVEDKLTLRLGSKFEHNEFGGTEAQPSARISWKPTENQLLWASVTRAIRTPTPYDQNYWVMQYRPEYAPTYVVYAKQVGNEDVETVDLIAHEIGYRVHPIKRLSVDMTAFSNDYSNLLTTELKTTIAMPGYYIFPVYLDNNLDAKYIGAEVSVDFDVFDWWRLHAAQSWLHMDNKAHSGSGYDKEATRILLNQSSPKHKTDFHSYMDLPGNVELDLIFRSVSRIPSKNVSGYNNLDARIGWEVKPNLEISVVGQSLLDDHHPEESTTSVLVPYTEVPRSVYGKVQWEF
jgi:iron complex outermembrane receptor protein